MNKKLTTLMLGMFLVSFAIAGISIGNVLNKDMLLEKPEVTTLSSIGITTPTISNCEKIDDYTCKFNIYEENAINKDIKIVIKECLNWSESDNESDMEFESECLDWWNLNQAEIETRVQEHTEKILENIADVTIARKDNQKEYLSDKIEITIKEKSVIPKL